MYVGKQNFWQLKIALLFNHAVVRYFGFDLSPKHRISGVKKTRYGQTDQRIDPFTEMRKPHLKIYVLLLTSLK